MIHIVLRVEDSKLKATSKEECKLDKVPASGDNSRDYPDGVSGPEFDQSLRADAVIVVSVVMKEHGFSNEVTRGKTGNLTIDDARAKKEQAAMGGSGYAHAYWDYMYIWIDPDKMQGVQGGEAAIRNAILQAVKEVEKKDKRGNKKYVVHVSTLLDNLKKAGIDLSKFKGQLVIGEDGKCYLADLDGKSKGERSVNAPKK